MGFEECKEFVGALLQVDSAVVGDLLWDLLQALKQRLRLALSSFWSQQLYDWFHCFLQLVFLRQQTLKFSLFILHLLHVARDLVLPVHADFMLFLELLIFLCDEFLELGDLLDPGLCEIVPAGFITLCGCQFILELCIRSYFL